MNTCNYSDEWQPYINDYDKFEYDIKLKDGTIVENCYPNARKFSSISDKHNAQSFPEEQVAEIKFSENPRFGINESVSKHPQYTYLNEPYVIENPYIEWDEPYGRKKFICKGRHQYREIDKIWICQCGKTL